MEVRREPVHVQSGVTAGKVLLHQTPAMNRTAIPQQHDWLVKMALDPPQFFSNGSLLLQRGHSTGSNQENECPVYPRSFDTSMKAKNCARFIGWNSLTGVSQSNCKVHWSPGRMCQLPVV